MTLLPDDLTALTGAFLMAPRMMSRPDFGKDVDSNRSVSLAKKFIGDIACSFCLVV